MKRSKCIFVIILAVTQVIFSQDESWKLFDDTEVDEIQITIDSGRLEWIYIASDAGWSSGQSDQ